MGDRLIQKRSRPGLSRKSLMVQHTIVMPEWALSGAYSECRKSLGNSMVSGFLSLVRNAKSVRILSVRKNPFHFNRNLGAKEFFTPA